MTRGIRASLIAIGGVLVLGAGYLTVEVAQVDPFARRTTVTMMLDNSAGLATRSPVLLRGIEIGHVARVDYTPSGVEVVLEFRGEPRIPIDSPARIETLSALGEPYIEFTPDSAEGPFLHDGQRLDSTRVKEPASLARAAQSAAHLLNALDPSALASLTRTLDRASAGAASVAPQLSRSTELLGAALMTRLPAIRQLLSDLQDMGGDMDWFESATAESSPLWSLFAQRFSEIVDSMAGIADVGDTPAMYLDGDGLVPTVGRITDWLRRNGPELARLTPVVSPSTADAQTAPIDLGALIAQALAAVGPDGTVHLRLTLK